MPDRVAARITHGAFLSMPSSTTPVDFHRICAIIVWNLYFFCNEVKLAAISTFRVKMHVVTNVFRAVAATECFDYASDLSHFTLAVYEGAGIFQFADAVIETIDICPRRGGCC